MVALADYVLDADEARLRRDLGSLAPEALAGAFVEGGFAAVAFAGLADQRWLRARESVELAGEFDAFVDVAFARELGAIASLAPAARGADARELRAREARASEWVDAVVAEARGRSFEDRREFLARAVRGMEALAEGLEAASERARAADRAYVERMRPLEDAARRWPRGRPLPHEGSVDCSLYRAFDAFDEALGLDYSQESRARFGRTRERLYEGAGAGVQTSYATVLLALRSLRLKPGARLVDLGSGYGRVGLAAGLAREDLFFVGYEFVEERVVCAREAARLAGLDSRIEFRAQDLGDPSFVIPEADAYYLYDPFCSETYVRVLSRILEVAERRPVSVVAKGYAGDWMREATDGLGWVEQRSGLEEGLWIFRSPPPAGSAA